MTKEISHHLPDDLLMAYAAGTLPEAMNLIIACHVSLCDDCRAAVASYDALGGAVLDGTTGLPTDFGNVDDALAATFARIDAANSDVVPFTAAKPEPVAARSQSILPAPLHDYVGSEAANIPWRPVGGGVRQAILSTSKDATARLLYIPAGMSVPDHSHEGLELTLVLQGAFEDEDGYFARGDIEVADGDLQHTPVADIHEDCICLAVTDAPLKFTGLIPRILQPFLKI